MPAAASIASRISSASSRRGVCRQTSRFAGSAARWAAVASRAELIGPAQDERPHQLLDRPAVADEPARQVVEQLGVRRRVAGDAEVIDRA